MTQEVEYRLSVREPSGRQQGHHQFIASLLKQALSKAGDTLTCATLAIHVHDLEIDEVVQVAVPAVGEPDQPEPEQYCVDVRARNGTLLGQYVVLAASPEEAAAKLREANRLQDFGLFPEPTIPRAIRLEFEGDISQLL